MCGLVFINHGSVCHGNWSGSAYMKFFSFVYLLK